MERFDVPEILRISLDEIFLQAMQLLRMRSDKPCDSTNVISFLLSSLDAPNRTSVENAIANLVELGALASAKQHNIYELTTFGEVLARLPVDPRIGKMLLVGLYFECFDSILTIATASCYRTPFVLPLNDRDKKRARQSFERFGARQNSDHIALLNAFNGWTSAFSSGGRRAGEAYCRKNFLSTQTMYVVFEREAREFQSFHFFIFSITSLK